MGDRSFLSDIPLWLYILVIALGVATGLVLIILSGSARRKAGGRPGAGTLPLTLGILSLALLGAVPLALMLIAQPWQNGTPAGTIFAEGDADRPISGSWRVRFDADGVNYEGEFRPAAGEGPLLLAYRTADGEAHVRQTCRVEDGAEIRIACRDPLILAGNVSYNPDSFRLRRAGDNEMTGDVVGVDGRRQGSATFTRGSVPGIPPSAWTDPGRVAPRFDPTTTAGSAPAPATASQAEIVPRLSAAVAQLRARLPLQSGPTTIRDVQANGTTMIMYVTINQSMAGQWAQLDQVLRTNICGGAFGPVIRQGATARIEMSDATGAQHSSSISSC